MKKYLTINEFAKLRNVNTNSLRYYEKLGLLIPARIDPHTKYRYYLPEQLIVLDTILLCIKFGIPLKQLNGYIDENGTLNQKKILEDGRLILQQKISDMQNSLNLTEFNLKTLEQNQIYYDKKETYTREIEERHLLIESFHGNWDDLIQKEKTVMKLFQIAQESDMLPVFPAGILVHCEENPISFAFFVQVLKPLEHDSRIIHLPKSQYLCIQADITSKTDITEVLAESFPSITIKTAIISNMLLNKLYLGSRHSEIQIRISS